MNLSKLRNGVLVHMAGLELGSSDTFLHRIKNGIQKWRMLMGKALST